MRTLIAITLAACVWLAPLASAEAQTRATTADRVVALAPLSTLGDENRSKKTAATQKILIKGLASVPGHRIIAGRSLDRAVRKAKRRDLRACDGDASCLAKLGALVKADWVVYGELGGLGDSRVAYLKLVDVASGKELRSTTLELNVKNVKNAENTQAQRASRSAAFRLLAPDLFVGTLAAKIDIKKATLYVNGKALGRSPAKPVRLSVGTHALRVTHPEYRDFVRFIDIRFGKTTTVDVSMKQYGVISKDILADGKNPAQDANVIYRGRKATPWFRRWYTIAGGSAALFVGSAVLFGVLANGIDVDDERVVDRPR